MYLEIFLYITFHHAFPTILYNNIHAFPTKLHNNIHAFQISTDFIYTDICYANYLTKAYAINLDHFLDHHLDHSYIVANYNMVYLSLAISDTDETRTEFTFSSATKPFLVDIVVATNKFANNLPTK